MTNQCELLLRRLYDTERRLPERNYAKDHSFDEWRLCFFDERGHHIIEGEYVPWEGTQASQNQIVTM